MQIYENRPAGTLLTDLSYRSANFKQFCPDLQISYSLQSEGNFLFNYSISFSFVIDLTDKTIFGQLVKEEDGSFKASV